MMNSGLFDSKFTGTFSATDTHDLFTSIYQKITTLESMRIVEKIARPISRQQKIILME